MSVVMDDCIQPKPRRVFKLSWRDTRPTSKPPMDRQHEFLKSWLPKDHIVVQHWTSWFKQRRTPFTIQTSGTMVMLYVHKVVTTKHSEVTVWCCQD